MPKKTNVIQSCIGLFLQENGYKRKANSWYLDAPEAILVVNLQKSQYSQQYYVNLGIWLKQLGVAASPKEHHCHIRGRLSGEKTERALDLEDSGLTVEERKQALVSALKRRALPFLRSCSTAGSVKRMLRNRKLENAGVSGKVRELVNSLPRRQSG